MRHDWKRRVVPAALRSGIEPMALCSACPAEDCLVRTSRGPRLCDALAARLHASASDAESYADYLDGHPSLSVEITAGLKPRVTV